MKVSYFDKAYKTTPYMCEFESLNRFAQAIEDKCKKPPIEVPYAQRVKDNPANAAKILDQNKRDGAAISLSIYRPDAETRHVVNIQSVTGVCGDLDGITEEQFQSIKNNLAELNVTYYGFTTWSHGWAKKGVCVKLIVPFMTEIRIDGNERLFRAAWSRLNELLFLGLSDRATCDASRLIFLPRVPAIVGNETGWFVNKSPEFFRCGDNTTPLFAGDIFEEARESLTYDPIKTARTINPEASPQARMYFEKIIESLENASDGEKHHQLLKASYAAGGLCEYLSESEIEAELLAVVNIWQSQGRVSSLSQAIKTVQSGITKGKLQPIYLELKAEEEIDIDLSALEQLRTTAEPFVPPAKVIQLHVEKEEDDDDISAEKVWREFAEMNHFCDAFAEELEARVEFRQPAYMLASGIACAATIGSRRNVFDGLTTSMYISVVGGTGTGKNAPAAFCEQLLGNKFGAFNGPSDFASWPATLARIADATQNGDHGLLFNVDEYGALVKQFFSPNSHLQPLRGQLLKLGTVGAGSLRFAQSLARGGADLVLDAPSIVILGSTTEEALEDAMSSELGARDGFFGRHLWFTGASRLPSRTKNVRRGAIGNKLLEQIDRQYGFFRDWKASLVRKEVETSKRKDDEETRYICVYAPNEIGCTDKARDVLDAFIDRCDDERRKRVGDALEGITARLGEQAKRIALTVAGLRGNDSQITEREAQFAVNVALLNRSNVNMRLRNPFKEKSQDLFERKLARYTKGVIRLQEKGGDHSMRDILRATTLKKQDIAECAQYCWDIGRKDLIPDIVLHSKIIKL